ncbi:hypothetical protein [uncultured Thiodictyon sp.]|uniref:hypothetical protein n=1 Tax=uncultured Thiodictyon sp. TaxID=1846217 RepID=UPI0025D28BEC|nr:hypothetical protein [uncultured Thiodictyon sp.]
MKISALYRLSLMLLFFAAASVAAKEPPQGPARTPEMVYVEDFQSGMAPGSARGGPLTGLESRRRSVKTSGNAAELSQAIVTAFIASGVSAQPLPPGRPLPRAGWLVRGQFYATDARGHHGPLPAAVSGAPPAPNTQVTVSVADLAVNPDSPLVVFGTTEALPGQGPPVGWDPYVVAAKFVINQAQSRAGIDALARQIVAVILKNKATIAKTHAASTSAH